MQKIFSTLIILLIPYSCRQTHKINPQNDILTFKVFLNPSFDESAQIVLSKFDTQQQIRFLILDKELDNKHIDTFYFKTISLSKNQFEQFDSVVIQKTKIKQPPQREGCCDGIGIRFMTIQNKDTSVLHFGNLGLSSDTLAQRIIKNTFDNFRLLYNDSVINDYLGDIETYIDNSKKHIQWKENRPINKLRKIEYSRSAGEETH